MNTQKENARRLAKFYGINRADALEAGAKRGHVAPLPGQKRAMRWSKNVCPQPMPGLIVTTTRRAR